MAGYAELYRKRTLEKALKKYDKMVSREEEGVSPIHRPRSFQKEERRKKKRDKKRSWASKGGCIAPIMIPPTPNSELLNMLREIAQSEAQPGLKFKIIETGGRTIKEMVQKSNPTAPRTCNAGDCCVCHGEGGGGCRKSNVLYEFTCKLCPEDNKSVYLGETNQNLYTRGREHRRNYEKKEVHSFMSRHQQECHFGADAKFDAKVLASFHDCLSRQTAEGVHIRRCEKNILSTKAEWHQPALWRVRNELSRE